MSHMTSDPWNGRGHTKVSFIRCERAQSESKQPVFIFVGVRSALFSQKCLDQLGQDQRGINQDMGENIEFHKMK